MNNAVSTWLLPALAIAFTIFVWYQSKRAKGRAENSQEKRADIQAYDSARITYENQVKSLRLEVQALRDQMDGMSRRLSSLETEVNAKSRLISVATIYIRQLLNVLAVNGIKSVPAVPADLEGSI